MFIATSGKHLIKKKKKRIPLEEKPLKVFILRGATLLLLLLLGHFKLHRSVLL